MKYILAFDQGTTSSRALLFDSQGRLCATAQKVLPQSFPANGLVEHDAIQIWQDQLQVAREVLQTTGVHPQEVAALGITNQRETTILWDRQTGQPLAPAIVWQDRRTANICQKLIDDGHEPMIHSKTGLLADAYFSASKLQWLLDHLPDARQRARKGELAFGTVDTWLVWNLTQGQCHITDPSNASRTLLFNIHTGDWDPQLLALFDIPPEVLPALVPSLGVAGMVAREHLGAEIPIAALVGDQQAATFGQACFKEGMVKNTYGTGCFLLMNTGQDIVQSQHRLLTTIGWQKPAIDSASNELLTTYCLEGSVFMAGATVQWLRDGLNLFERTADIEPLAASVTDTEDMFLVPALTGLGAPHWDAHARGLMIGMSRATNRAHIARAALESIALQVTDLLNALQQDAISTHISQLRVDGAAAQNNLLMQMQADFSGYPVYRPKITETTAQGAAWMAGLATGIWSDLSTLEQHWQTDRIFEPQWSDDQRDAHLKRWHQALERAKAWHVSNDEGPR